MRALVLSAGGLRGAYDAGVAAALCRELGSRYFDAIYMSSSGSFAGAFYAANQPDVIENTWRNFVSGSQLVNYLNPLRGRNILDTEYLIDLFKGDESHLDVNEVFDSGVVLKCIAVDTATGLQEVLSPTRNNIFEVLLASSAIPIIHLPVKLGTKEYIDGAFVDPTPFKQAIGDGHSHVVFVCNKEKNFKVGWFFEMLTKILSILVPKPVRKDIHTISDHYERLEKEIAANKMFIIRPQQPLNANPLTRNKRIINELVDFGLEDGSKAAAKIKELYGN